MCGLQVASRVRWAAQNETAEGGRLGQHAWHVTGWSLHRRNFDHITNFTITPILLSGFNHPASNPKVFEGLIQGLQEPPFTRLSLTGVSLLEWEVRLLRYKSEMASSTWTTDGTDGGLLAAMPNIIAECNPDCSTTTVGSTSITADLSIAQSEEKRNGVVELAVTLKGQGSYATRVLVVEIILVLDVPGQVNMTEDSGRLATAFYVPSLLKPQEIPCVARIKIAGDLNAPVSLADIQFMFDVETSYAGNTNILSIRDYPTQVCNSPCHFRYTSLVLHALEAIQLADLLLLRVCAVYIQSSSRGHGFGWQRKLSCT